MLLALVIPLGVAGLVSGISAYVYGNSERYHVNRMADNSRHRMMREAIM